MTKHPSVDIKKPCSLTVVEQFELDRKAFAAVAKETGMFEVLAGFAKAFGRIPSASITTDDGVTTSYETPPNITMPKLGHTNPPKSTKPK